MARNRPVIAGEVFDVAYPFIRSTYQNVDVDEEGVVVTDLPTWAPGTRHADKGEGDVESIADSMGLMVLTVIGQYSPAGFPTRVFFTRGWVDPKGKPFGKRKCHVLTAGTFWARTRGFAHPFVLADCKCDGCDWPYEDHRLKGHRVNDEPEPDGEAFRGRERAESVRETQAALQRDLKR